MIPEKMLNANRLLRPTFSPQDARGDLQSAYKQWYVMAMIPINFYVELLIKQLNRKGRSSFQSEFGSSINGGIIIQSVKVSHPLYNYPTFWAGADIKSGSKAPYERENYANLGLNQFFVGQNPKEWYQGDPGDDNGIYHDTSRIVTTENQGLMQRAPKYINQVYVPEDKGGDNASGHSAYTSETSLNYTFNCNVACNEKMYIAYKDRLNLYLCEEITQNYSVLYKPEIKNYKIIKKSFVYPKGDLPKQSVFFNDRDMLNFQNRLNAWLDEFKALNGGDIKTIAPLSYQIISQYPMQNDNVGKVELKYGSVSVSFKAVLEDYASLYPVYLHPIYFENSLSKIVFREPIFTQTSLYTDYMERGKAYGRFYYLYNYKSGGVYGRRDKWLSLWQNFYTLRVREDKGTGGFVGFIFNVAVFVVSVVVAYYTGYYVGEALSAVLGSVISGTTALGVQVGVMGVSLGAGLMVGLGTTSGNAFFANLGSVILGVVGLVGAGANLVTAATTATAQGMQVSTLQVATSAVNTLSSAVNVINGINTFMQTMDKGQDLLSESESEDEFFSGKSDEEVAKDFLEPSVWYDLNTADLLEL